MAVRHASLFSQIVGLFDRNRFARLVSEHSSGRNATGSKSWGHFVSTLFCQMAQAKSLRQRGHSTRSNPIGARRGSIHRFGVTGTLNTPA
ncbi:DUF4372 domain-containing protein [Desulfoluna limicola]|uniref:DUF4372 domain-containing protein n=1 Tax=Desulfoluna limicola TaxID=2810562 RepID=UPI001F2E71CA|nr:DUF4372 domain-containing protein [Desulfoluna limicola]